MFLARGSIEEIFNTRGGRGLAGERQQGMWDQGMHQGLSTMMIHINRGEKPSGFVIAELNLVWRCLWRVYGLQGG